jgi:hypothetical protein
VKAHRFWVAALGASLAACGSGGSSHSNGQATTSGAESTSSAEPVSGDSSGTPLPERHGGLQLHIQNIHAGGSLPEEADPRTDHLDVSFELVMNHTGTEPLTGLNVTQARLVHDDGRQVVFGVLGDQWDGRLDAGQQRVVAFHKTPDSAQPRATHSLCGQHMRLDVIVDLAGRQAHAFSRHVQIECPH